MHVITRQVDQWVQIGRDVLVSPTDIDAASVRLVARGRVLGGADDGAPFESTHELSLGQSFHAGPGIVVTVLKLRPPHVDLGVSAPKHVAWPR